MKIAKKSIAQMITLITITSFNRLYSLGSIVFGKYEYVYSSGSNLIKNITKSVYAAKITPFIKVISF
jgi:hypothetical protein